MTARRETNCRPTKRFRWPWTPARSTARSGNLGGCLRDVPPDMTPALLSGQRLRASRGGSGFTLTRVVENLLLNAK